VNVRKFIAIYMFLKIKIDSFCIFVLKVILLIDEMNKFAIYHFLLQHLFKVIPSSPSFYVLLNDGTEILIHKSTCFSTVYIITYSYV